MLMYSSDWSHYGRLALWADTIEWLEGLSPSEHAAFWKVMWRIRDFKERHPEEYDEIIGAHTKFKWSHSTGETSNVILRHLADMTDKDFQAEKRKWGPKI